jgi:hypothetical protein
MENTTMPDSDEVKWPSVRAAYDFVIPSYNLLASRFEAADTRLTILLTFAATITLGAPILARAAREKIDFASPWFGLAIASFILSIGMGLVARVRGTLILPNPMKIYTESLHETEWAFRKNAIYFAGQHFSANAKAIRIKGNVADIAAALIILEILLLLTWFVRAS